MLNSVSFAQNTGVFSPVDVNKPQAYRRSVPGGVIPSGAESKDVKKHTAGHVIGGIVTAAIAAGGALAAGKHFKTFDKIAEFAGEKLAGSKLESLNKPVKKVTDSLNKAGDFIITKSKDGYNAIKGFFSKPKTAEQPIEA